MTRKLATLLGLLALATAACLRAGSDSSVLEVTAREYAFGVESKPVAPGIVRIHLTNQGREGHQAQIARINDGYDEAAVGRALKQGEAALFKTVTLQGGPTGVAPGRSQLTAAMLKPGTYMLFCFLPTPDGKASHIEKGMSGSFRVHGGEPTATRLASVGKITARDMRIALPKDFAGRGTYEFANNGSQPHEATFIRLLTPSASAKDVFAAFGGDARAGKRFELAGGVAAVPPGGTAWMQIALKPGRYIAICFVPDPKKHAPHAALGMVTPFTIS